MNISFEGWVLIGLAAFLILAAIGSAIHVMKKYPPESVFPDSMSESDVISAIIGPADDDDD